MTELLKKGVKFS
jgi:hypothetical protein